MDGGVDGGVDAITRAREDGRKMKRTLLVGSVAAGGHAAGEVADQLRVAADALDVDGTAVAEAGADAGALSRRESR